MELGGEFGGNDPLLHLRNLQMELKSPYLNSTGGDLKSQLAGVVPFIFKSPGIGVYLALNVKSPTFRLSEPGKVA